MNGFRRVSSHCITVSSDQYQEYKFLAVLKQYLILVKKEQWGDFSVQTVRFCELARDYRLSSEVIFND